MDAPSDKSPDSWAELAGCARRAEPQDIDMRAAIRAKITAQPARVIETAPAGMIDDLAGLFQVRWLQAGLGVLAFIAFLSCSGGYHAVQELAIIWQLHGPTLFGI